MKQPAKQQSATGKAVQVGDTITTTDLELFASFEDFLPSDIFDSHVHVYRQSEVFPELGTAGTPEDMLDVTAFRTRHRYWMGDHAEVDALIFPFPRLTVNPQEANRLIVSECATHRGCRGLLLTTPAMNPKKVLPLLEQPGIIGFKPYHIYSTDRSLSSTFLAETETFLPEWALELAHERQLFIMLHLVLPLALADIRNIEYLRSRCLRYPRARIILAHAARGFNAWNTHRGIHAIADLDNVFFDTSAVCEAEPFIAILKACGPSRLLYGTDFPVSMLRTKAITIGDGFHWLDPKRAPDADWQHGKTALNGIEMLRALRVACEIMDLNRRDIENIFAGNARDLFGLPRPRPLPDVQAQYKEACQVFPGGVQLFSKKPELFAPGQWPAYYEEAHGCRVRDTSGKEYIDMSLGGILACILGYADPDVNAAVINRVRKGSMSTLQTYEEVEVAKELISIHPWAERVRFARTGGEVMALAVRIARSVTGRSKVVICGYHGWHDWYLAANLPENPAASVAGSLDRHLMPGLEPRGVPQELAGTTFAFVYNDLDGLEKILRKHGDEIAAVVVESTRGEDPKPGFLEGVIDASHRVGAKVIFDEITIGWRLCLGGAHLKYGVTPDLASFAKTISNGFPMAAVIGTAAAMRGAEQSFISSAYWSEGVGPAAALATIRKLKSLNVPAHLNRIGSRVMQGWRDLGVKHGLPVVAGSRPEIATISFNSPDNLAMLTYMTAHMLKRGFLASANFNAMLAHEDHHIDAYLVALDEVFGEMKKDIANRTLLRNIGGPVKQSGFARLAK